MTGSGSAIIHQNLPRRLDHPQNNEMPVFRHCPAQNDRDAEYHSADRQQLDSEIREKEQLKVAKARHIIKLIRSAYLLYLSAATPRIIPTIVKTAMKLGPAKI